MAPGITLLLDAPYFSGAAATSDVPNLLPVGIGGHGYLAELSKYQRVTIERFRNPYDQSPEPGEHSLNTRGPWLRSQAIWHHGAGQDFWDQNDSDRDMFRTSKGVNVWPSATDQSAQNRVRLQNDTRSIRSSSNTNLALLAVGAYLYMIDGTEVYSSTNPTVASPTWTAANINIAEGARTVTSITTDGNRVWAAVGTNGIHYTALGATSATHLSAFAAKLVAYANGRLLAANGPALAEISYDGATTTTLKTHPVASFSWTAIADAPNGIYAAGNLGDRAEIYFIGLKADHSLDAPIYAATLPTGETINDMTFYNGIMILATSVGLRLATITDADGLSYGPAIKISGGATGHLEPQAEFVWFGWTNFDATSSGLGRASLATFTTSALVPAYASDLMATAQGSVLSIATFSNKRYFAVSAVGIFAEFSDLVASGYFYTGWINFSTGERKVAISVDMRHEPLAGSVLVEITKEDNTVTNVGTSSTTGSLSPDDPLSTSSISSEAFELKFTLSRSSSDHTTGPTLRRWTFRALITPVRVDQITLPIWLKSTLKVDDPGEGHEVAQNPLVEFQYLKALEASGAPVTYQQGTQSESVYIESVQLAEDPDRYWSPDRSFPEGLALLELITLSTGG